MIIRILKDRIQESLKRSPAVLLVGARQVGKTTLAKELTGNYYDLEIESERLRLELEWSKVEESHELIAFDEAQNFPELFIKLRSIIDKEKKKMEDFYFLGQLHLH
jgi:uncharacterized protein